MQAGVGGEEGGDRSDSPCPACSKSVWGRVLQRLSRAQQRAGHALSEIQEGFQEGLAFELSP